MVYGKLVNGELELLKSFIRVDGNDVFTTAEDFIVSNGYKPVRYVEPETREGYFVSGFTWSETDTEIVQEWIYEEINYEQN